MARVESGRGGRECGQGGWEIDGLYELGVIGWANHGLCLGAGF